MGLLAKTFAPVPVSSVSIAARFTLVGVARNVAAPVARPLMPVATGSPVQEARLPLEGVPSTGVTSVGDVLKTARPVPVSSVRTPASCAEVVAANWLRGFVVSALPPPDSVVN